MRNIRSFVLLFILLFFVSTALEAQRNRRGKDAAEEPSWPPERRYANLSLGSALQRVFQKHYNFCGFPAAEGSRDYTPPTIEQFLGRRTLRTRVEQANLSGGKLLNYIFSQEETEAPLDAIQYKTDRSISLREQATIFLPQPREGFDAFVMTKNCGGYLKACLDAGIKPPYSAFSMALGTDEKRESSVLTLAGSFESPLSEIIAARDSRTTELMSRLWLFYQQHPEYIGKAYYLREFEGVLVKHLSNAEAVFQSERELGVNVNLPFSARIKSTLTQGKTASQNFQGTDWETIVYADFEGPYQRQNMYSPLPSPADISDYFASLQLTFNNASDFPLLTEGAEHRHYLTLVGMPAELARMPWLIREISEGTYAETPKIDHYFFEEANGQSGLKITVSGLPAPQLFSGRPEDRSGSVPLRYAVALDQELFGQRLQLRVDKELGTSSSPIVHLLRANFDLTKRDSRDFAFLWEVELALEDRDNPVDYNKEALVSNIVVRNSNSPLAVELLKSEFDARRHSLLITFASRDAWPLARINDQQMENYNLSADVHLPIQRGTGRTIRPIKAVIAVPNIREEVVETAAPQNFEAVEPAPLPNAIPSAIPAVPKGGD